MQYTKRAIFDRGSALIITILLVTVLAAIAFSTSRLTISEIVQTGQLEDSELSYQAAEGCVETGLLLYRYNRDAEVPADVDGGMSESVDEYAYFDITDGLEVSKDEFDSRDKDASYCSLRMWHHNDAGESETVETSECTQKKFDAGLCVSVDLTSLPSGVLDTDVCGADMSKCYLDTGGTYYVVPALAQDQVVEYDVEGMDNVTLEYKYLSKPKENESEYKVISTSIGENGSIDSGKYVFNYGDSSPFLDLYSGYNIQKIRIKSLGDSLASFNLTSTNNVKLDSKYTYIESVGYYGSAKRKLKVSLDRTTGSLLSPYDFILYSSE